MILGNGDYQTKGGGGIIIYNLVPKTKKFIKV